MNTNIAYIEDDIEDFDYLKNHFDSNSEMKVKLKHFPSLKHFTNSTEKEMYKFLVLDLGLPDSSNPLEILNELAEKQNSNIVVLTGNKDSGEELFKKFRSVVGFVTKEKRFPIRVEETILGVENLHTKVVSLHKTERQEIHLENFRRFKNLNVNLSHSIGSSLNVLTNYIDQSSESQDEKLVRAAQDSLEELNAICKDLLSVSATNKNASEIINLFQIILRLKMEFSFSKIAVEDGIEQNRIRFDYTQVKELVSYSSEYLEKRFEAPISQMELRVRKVKDVKEGYSIKVFCKNEIIKSGLSFDHAEFEKGFLSFCALELLASLEGVEYKFLQTEEGQGIVFHIPLTKNEETMQSSDEIRSKKVFFNPSSEYILYMEDNEVLRDLFTEFLRKNSFKVDSFCNGEEGLKAFQKNPSKYGLILSDLIMPVMNGITATREMQLLAPKPVVFITATDPEVVIKDQKLPFEYSVLAKPVRYAQLESRLKRYIEKEDMKAAK
ncbi:MAG: response regulator [Bdellovibrionota bacterium]|nr:response regulator [Bdellovibrionota bacterium]